MTTLKELLDYLEAENDNGDHDIRPVDLHLTAEEAQALIHDIICKLDTLNTSCEG